MHNIRKGETRLAVILNGFLETLGKGQPVLENPILIAAVKMSDAITKGTKSENTIKELELSDTGKTDEVLKVCDIELQHDCQYYKKLRQPVSYFISEMVCNMQQHSCSKIGYIFEKYNSDNQYIDIVMADGGISIYGSYVNTNKYLDKISNSDAIAIDMAKDGYSTKDLPEAENRGYGLSSNIRMITKGLNGEIAIISGNAIYISSLNKIIELPNDIEWKGTMIMAHIPSQIPESFNFYNYIS